MSKILALDIATKTGWATQEASGTWDFTLKRGESSGMKLIRFKSKVNELVQLIGKFDLIVYERPAGRNAASIIHQSEMIGVLKDYCEMYRIQYSGYSASEIKKFATGKGNSNKEAMIKAAEDYFQRVIIDDNHADALWLYEMVKTELN